MSFSAASFFDILFFKDIVICTLQVKSNSRLKFSIH